MRSRPTGSPEQLGSAQRRSLGVVLLFLIPYQPRFWRTCSRNSCLVGIEQTDKQVIPLRPNHSSDPARRRAVVSGFDLGASISFSETKNPALPRFLAKAHMFI
jgi:hypothetical protein